jgi:hypothetical protein
MTAKLKNKTYIARVTRAHRDLRKGERVAVYRRGDAWVVLTDRAIGGNLSLELTTDEATDCLTTHRGPDGRPYEATSMHFGIARIQHEDRVIRARNNS